MEKGWRKGKHSLWNSDGMIPRRYFLIFHAALVARFVLPVTRILQEPARRGKEGRTAGREEQGI